MSCISPAAGDRPTMTGRPKLTLQTSALPRTFGTSTTGLSRPFTAAAGTSPTVRNTFKNAYDVVASPTSAATSPSKGPSHRFPTDKPISPYVHHPSNNNTFNHRSAYQLPLGVRSILRNSPLDTVSHRRSGSISAGTSGPASAGTRRVFFPAKKQVSYRVPLEEEIRTTNYTASHLDLVLETEEDEKQKEIQKQTEAVAAPHQADRGPEEPKVDSTDESDSSQTSSASSTSDEASADEGVTKSTLSKLERKKRRTMRTERQVRAVALLDGLDTDQYTGSSTPQTPRQGRVKRRREWTWTLGPIHSIGNTSPSSASSATTTPETPCISSASTVDEPKMELPSCQQEQ
ncbi:hypothetical protein N7478_010366 [Penicillium angulare]|uniref:uncharacterized protein n=1 Tax=Penicillium angulare TaxID=116970 RepID=UPI00254175B5|nr:uncharacterized protein N7478_010366 [Penicillium angulare]KAJ5267558.1 hypothetical protein N7478_010366 [Penicillium angulare]